MLTGMSYELCSAKNEIDFLKTVAQIKRKICPTILESESGKLI